MSTFSNKAITLAIFWKFLERISVQAITLLVSIVLARILSPEDFGAVAFLMIFISIGQVFVTGGFNTALIQKKNVENNDFSTVFLFSMGVTVILYALTCLLAVPFANWFAMPSLVTPLKVLALILIPNSVVAVQVAYATKKMDFRSIFFANLYSVLGSGVLGIFLAVRGYGLWSIVYYQLAHAVLTMIFLFILVPWRPRLTFCMKSCKCLWPFGTKMLFCNLMVTIFMDIRGVLIGKVGNSFQLAYFERGKLFPATFMGIVGQILQSVLLPVLSEKQNNLEELQIRMRYSIRACMFFTVPCLLILLAVSKHLVIFLLTAKWLPAVFFLNCFALTYLFHPAQYVTFEALKARGYGSQCIWIEIIRKFLEISSMIIAIPYGVKILAGTVLLNGIASSIVMLPFNSKYLCYKVKEQIFDQFSFYAAGGIMCLVLFFIDLSTPDYGIKWLPLAIIGFVIYFATLMIAKNDVAVDFYSKCKQFVVKENIWRKNK